MKNIDVTGKFGSQYTQLGRNIQAQGRVINHIGEATEKLFNSLTRAANVYNQERAKETPEDREYKNEQERAMDRIIAEDAAGNRFDPDKFEIATKKRKEEYLKDIPEDKLQWASETYEQKINGYYHTINANKLQMQRERQLESFTTKAQELQDKAINAAVHGDTANQAFYTMQWQENEEYMFNNGFLGGAKKATRAQDFTDKMVVGQNVAGARQLFGNSEQLNNFMARIDKSNYSMNQKRSIKNGISAEYNNWQAMNKVKNADTVKTADFGIKAIGMGLEPENFDYDETLAKLKSAGLEDKANELEEAYKTRQDMISFAQLSPAQMNSELDELKKTAKDTDDLKRLKTLTSLVKNAQKQIDDDPLSFASAHGVIDDSPIDFENPETIQARLQNAQFVQEKYGLDHAPVLKKNEVDGLKKAVSNASDEQKAVLLQTINSSFGSEAGQVFSEIASDNPEFAIAGKVFNDNPQVAVNIVNGVTIGNNEKGFKPTQNTTLHNAFGKLDSALKNFSTEDVNAVKKAVVANMTYINKKNNIYADGEAVDSDKVKFADEAMEQVLGGKVVGMNGWWNPEYYTVLPANKSKADFEDWIDSLKDGDVSNSFVGDKRVNAEDVRNLGHFNYNDNGSYTVTINGEYVRHPNGEPLILTYGDKK